MSENETQQTPAAEIPEVQLSESELEQVAGGCYEQVVDVTGPLIEIPGPFVDNPTV
jgi:hypothetical protein